MPMATLLWTMHVPSITTLVEKVSTCIHGRALHYLTMIVAMCISCHASITKS